MGLIRPSYSHDIKIKTQAFNIRIKKHFSILKIYISTNNKIKYFGKYMCYKSLALE